MKWLKSMMEYIMAKLDKFSKIGRNMISEFPRLIQYFNQESDIDLKKFIIKANIIKAKDGRIQIQVMTANGWDFLDDSFVDELRSLLGANCFEVDLDDAAELASNFQESLNNFLKKSKEIFSATVRKNKM